MPTPYRVILPQSSFLTDFFALQVCYGARKTIISMRVFAPILYTSDMPSLARVLEKFLPSIMHAECFNYEGLSFMQEVQDTEIGHLFEHIVLEYLCDLKIAHGFNKACFSGVTSWNWKRYERGTFTITINAGYQDALLVSEAVGQGVRLLSLLLHSNLRPVPCDTGLVDPLIDDALSP